MNMYNNTSAWMSLNGSVECAAPSSFLQRHYDDYTARPLVRVLTAVVYGLVLSAGLALNLSVVIAVASQRHLRSARNVLLVNLMLCDLVLCLVSVVVVPVTVTLKYWLFGTLMCRLMLYTQSIAVMVSSWTLTAIALDKYVHIDDPTKSPLEISTALGTTVLIWTCTAVVNLPYVLAAQLVDGTRMVMPGFEGGLCGLYCKEEWGSYTWARRAYGTVVMLIQFVLPTIVMSFCYYRIFTIVKRDMIVSSANYSHSLSGTQRTLAQTRKTRVIQILCAMVATFVVSWLPLTVFNVILDYDLSSSLLRQQYQILLVCHVFAMSTVISNPLLFYWLTMVRKKVPQDLRKSTNYQYNSEVSQFRSTATAGRQRSNNHRSSSVQNADLRIEDDDEKAPLNNEVLTEMQVFNCAGTEPKLDQTDLNRPRLSSAKVVRMPHSRKQNLNVDNNLLTVPSRK